jgi:parallel beta-helix repeat protein
MRNNYKKIGMSLIIIGFLITGVQTSGAISQHLTQQPTTTTGWLYVGGGGPGNYSTIQSAINAASNGDTIYVYAGTYPENIVVDKSVILIGEDRNITTISGNSLNTTMKITAESVILQGFTIANDGSQDGVYTATSYHIFTNNVFTMTSRAIHLYYSSQNTITGNLFYGNTVSGVFMEVGQNNTISGNEFYNITVEAIYLTGCGATHIDRNAIHHNGEGIHALEATGIVIRNNTIAFNGYGIRFTGFFTVHSNFNTISHNAITNNSVCGIHIEHSQFNHIEFNEIKRNGVGIEFVYTGLNVVSQNEIMFSTNNEITLTLSLGDTIQQNNINNTQQSLVLLQVKLGFSNAVNNWWGSQQWPQRRIRPIFGWVIVMPWKMSPFTLNVGPE